MGTTSFNHSLLVSPEKRSAKPICKTIFLTISLVAIVSLASFVAFCITTNNHLPVCATAGNPTACLAIISKEIAASLQPMTKFELLQLLLKRSVAAAAAASHAARLLNLKINDPRQQSALSDCVELMDLSRDRLDESSMALLQRPMTSKSHSDVHSWLSAVLTNHVTCVDGLHRQAKSSMKPDMDNLVALASTSLAIVSSVSPPADGDHQTLLTTMNEYPSWLGFKDRSLLEARAKAIQANVVVAKDGSGKYRTVQEGVDSAPDNGATRYVIYVKRGVYKEQVLIGKKKKNVMLVGDGMDATIITGSLNVVDGSTTFNSATVAAVGDGFIAQDIGFQNTAGPEKHQAVALRLGADTSVINRCKMDAYQDTLYAHSLRQFFRDSTITGTVDFVFGNAAVVFQNCKLVARKPMANQGNMVTAQGRTDPKQNTGTSIQKCQVIPSDDLVPVKNTIKTYLGRPWKEYSRTVYMQSYIDDHINPKGWSEWSGEFALKTLYYGEYANTGPGAGVAQRVTWPGYKVIKNATEASKFTVKELIQGGEWLKSTGVVFTEGL